MMMIYIYMCVCYIKRLKLFGEPELVLVPVRILNYKLKHLQNIAKPQLCAAEGDA